MSLGKRRIGRNAGKRPRHAGLRTTILVALCFAALPIRLVWPDVGLVSAQSAFAKDGESGSDHDSGNSGHGGKGGGGGDDQNDDDGGGHHGGHRNSSGRSVSAFVGLLTGKGKVVKVQKSLNSVEIEFADGWHERIQGGEYVLIDNKHRVVTRRPATDIDFRRLRAAETHWDGR